MTDENKRRNIAQEVALADRKLKDAEGLVTIEGYGTAIAAAYYCAFHYGIALLLMEGLESKTHKGLTYMLGVHFVQTGRLQPATASLLAQLFGLRQNADYNPGSVFTATMATEWLDKTREFRKGARALLAEGGFLPADV